ncbi:MAG: DUF1178 family protein [Paracoccaceae bacterium]
MIKYTLTCPQDHTFESWFQSAGAFDTLRTSGHVTCAVCGDADVKKTVMAPSVQTSMKAPQTQMKDLRDKIEATSEYVGPRFAAEARKMHIGDAPHRAIYGEANIKDARSLLADGVPVMPLPFIPTKKTN